MGQGISLIGTWITRLAQGWLVYRLTGSALLLGTVGFVGQIPTFLLAPFAGVWVDRLDRYRVLLVTQVLSMLQSALLAFFALTDLVTPTHVIVLAAMQGIINAFDTPARQTFLVQLVDEREDLPNAIALNSSIFNGARLVGPSIAGVTIGLVGEGWCFAIDAASYIGVLAAMLAMRLTPREAPPRSAGFASELRDGLAYIAGFAPIRDLLCLVACVSLSGMSYAVLMPVFANKVLGGGPSTLGILMASSGTGALLGALWLASRSSVVGLSAIVSGAGFVFSLALLGFSYSRWLPLSMPLLTLVGVGMMLQMAATNTLLQTLVEERMRGRVMSFYTMSFLGMTPFASLIAGFVASHLGAPVAVRIGALLSLVAVSVFALRLPKLHEQMNPVHERHGHLQPAAAGAASASELPPAGE